GTPDERGGDEQALLLAPGELADGAVGVGPRAHQRDDLLDAPALSGPPPAGARGEGEGNAPAGAVEAEGDEVGSPYARGGVEALALGEVADPGAGVLGRLAEDVHRARGERHQAQDRLHERRLAGAVGA